MSTCSPGCTRPCPVLATAGRRPLATVGRRRRSARHACSRSSRRSGHWLRVATADLQRGRDGWIDENAPGVTMSKTPVEIVIQLDSQDARAPTRPITYSGASPSASARPVSPTPIGRFAVTDELAGPSYSPVYGCCILALSARQTRLPGRLDAAATGSRSTARTSRRRSAQALSTGCLHAPTRTCAT